MVRLSVRLSVAVICLALCAASASADILSIQNTNGAAVVNLSNILSGSYDIVTIIAGSPSAGSINVINDTGAALTSMTLYYNGNTGAAAGANLSCQSHGNFNTTNAACYVDVNGTHYSNGASTPNGLPTGSYAFVWTFNGSAQSNLVASGAEFNIAWASFSHTDDNGCIGGTTSPNCSVVGTPEPASLTLLGGGLLVGSLRKRWTKKR